MITMAGTSSPSFSTNPVPALIARRTTVLAPPSLSTVNHLDTIPSSSSSHPVNHASTSSASHNIARRGTHSHSRSDLLATAVSAPTAAHPVSTRENISTSKTWSPNRTPKDPAASTSAGASIGNGLSAGEFSVHPTFRCDAGECRGDVLVRVDGVEFWVHKDVLLFSSPFFKSVLEGGWRESRLSRVFHDEEDAVERVEEASGTKTGQSGARVPHMHIEEVEAETEEEEQECASALAADDAVGLDVDEKHLSARKEGAARRRSLLRASYHTALCSQDDERTASPTLSQYAAAFPDASDTSTPKGSDEESDEERSTASEGDEVNEVADASHEQITTGDDDDAAPDYPQSVSKPARRYRGSSQLRSKHLAARLTLRKLEAAQAIPARSTSKPAGGLLPDSAARLESLATPPLSPLLTNPAQPEHEDMSTSKSLPSRYQGVISVIDLAEESPSTFHDFLHHAYPHLDLSVTWFNCGPLLRFADKFQVPFLRRSCVTFLRAALAGRPIEAMRLGELHGMDEVYKEASRHVLDNFAAWEPDELQCLSQGTLLKLERKRTWFLERLLKLGLANPARDYECHANCPDPTACAKALGEKWVSAYANAFRFSPPQPSIIFRNLRELDGSSATANGMQLSACQSHAKVWVQGLFDRMFELGTLHTPRQFLAVKLDSAPQRNVFRDKM